MVAPLELAQVAATGPPTLQRAPRTVRLVLVVLVLLVFGQCVGFDFVNFDDPRFVLQNHHLDDGLSLHGIAWAFSINDVTGYHPLTWVSYMVDRELFGLNPAGYHAVNVLLHIGSTLLLFSLLHAATGNLWASAVTAMLFAVHPLRAESVAWVAERKDALSACLGLGCLRAYVAYAARPTRARYAAVVGLFGLGLLAKPMLVTLPLVMLMLDHWPLRRLPTWAAGAAPGERLAPSVGWQRAIVEKLPLLALAAVSALLTILSQSKTEALRSVAQYPLTVRLANSLAGVGWYVAKLFVPTRLAVFYPFDRVPGAWEVVALTAGLFIVTALAVVMYRRRPYLLTGWISFLILLLPVVGIVQVGSQRVADRYSYLPDVGLLIAVVFLVSDLVHGAPRHWRVAAGAATLAAGLVLTLLGWRQVATFRDSVTLFSRALSVTENNFMAHANLAAALAASGRVAEAESHYREAARILPQWEVPHFGLGSLLEEQGHLDLAAAEYGLGLASNPRQAVIQGRLGLLLRRLGRVDEGTAHLQEAARLGNAAAGDELRLPDKQRAATPPP